MNQKRALGRGLGALIPQKAAEPQPAQTPGLAEIALEQIAPNPYQPRKIFNEASIEELARSVREHGIVQPLVVTRAGDNRYKLIAGEYDYVLIDSPPSLGLLTVNGLTAAQSVLVPMQCEYFALEGVSQLLTTVERVRDAVNPGLEIEGIVLTMYDDRMNLSRQVAEEVKNHFGEKVYSTIVPRNVRLGEAPSFGKPIILYDIRSRGSEAYVSLAKEFIRRAENVI